MVPGTGWIRALAAAVSALVALCAPPRANASPVSAIQRDDGIVVDQQPHRYGGFGSDTAFRDDWGHPIWQRVADDVRLSSTAVIRKITWWGFYGSSMDDYPEPAPASETMRIRVYQSRLADGLPDDKNVLYEESFPNPLRTATGRIVFTGPAPPEYVYEVNLSTPVVLQANTPYWLEIVQLENLDSHFRWEDGTGVLDHLAIVNNYHPWQYTHQDYYNSAFQLSSMPEPATLALVVLGVAALRITGRR